MIRSARGAVLLEMVIALAIFVGGAAMLSQLQTNVNRSLERARLSNEAADLARKALAELEAGIITLSDVRTMRVRTELSIDRMERRAELDEQIESAAWQLDVRTERSPYRGLTLVELAVVHVENPSDHALEESREGEVRVTLRQLMRLREESDDAEGETPP